MGALENMIALEGFQVPSSITTQSSSVNSPARVEYNFLYKLNIIAPSQIGYWKHFYRSVVKKNLEELFTLRI